MTQYTVSEVKDDSIEALCDLFTEVFAQPIRPEHWRWKYLDPALSDHINIVFTSEAQIRGHAGAIILPGRYHGHAVPIAQICDVMLAGTHRGNAGVGGAYAAIMTQLIAVLQQRIPQGLHYGFPGERPFRLGERLGFYRGTGKIIEWRMPASCGLSRYWRLCDLDWNTAPLDALWQGYISRPECQLVRDQRYLLWRYARHPEHRYRLIGVRFGLKISGWLVVRADGDTLRCVDRLVDENHLQPILSAVAGLAYAEGFETIAFWMPTRPAWSGVSAHATGMIGVVMPSSAPLFSGCQPFWQPGDADVY